MKYLEYLMWVAGFLAALLMIIGAISFFSGAKIMGIIHVVNYFHVANSLLLLAICIQLSLGVKKREG